MHNLPLGVELVVAALLVLGGVFVLVGAIGLLRLPDFYMRLHAPTKATTLGVGGVLLASMGMAWWRGEPGLHELLITLFLFITAPVSANLMAQAALHLNLPSRAGPAPGAAAAAAASPAASPAGPTAAPTAPAPRQR